MKYADVIVDITQGKLDKTFQYEIPESLLDKIDLGVAVVVPFGRNRFITGYVVGMSDEAKLDASKIKPITKLVKDAIPIESQMIALAAFMRNNFGGTMNQALKTVIPVKQKGSIKESKTVKLKMSEELARDYFGTLCARKNHSLAKEKLLAELLDKKSLDWEIITKKLEVSSSVIRDFEKEGIVEIITSRTFRDPVGDMEIKKPPVDLNDQQTAVVNEVWMDYAMGERNTYLLHGITGSGKTEVYMELIDRVLKEGKQAIVLIPEIALTYQTLMRFYGRFGKAVSILNSRMSPSERFDQFERAKSGDIQIMVGPRSALFTPFPNLGLIIIDEEHEATYKSETVPKYHARECAIYRAKLSNAFVVLGSATPSMDAYYRASIGEYKLLTLTKRAATDTMAQCEIVDLREELKRGNRSILSIRLQELIADRLAKKEQIMLFVNRRGMMGVLSCRACGHVIKCPHCDVSLSLHRDGKMHCHYCGYEEAKPTVCPECGSKYLGGFKAGTQKYEEMIQEMYPQARILRMDFDTTRGKHGHEEILSAFSNHEADILIGTQMIVKGHDFENVTLVGVLAADLSLNVSDYRCGERTFQLLTQAEGRAGRGKKDGIAIVQTYQPEHYAITTAKEQDYEAFYKQEIAYRTIMNYPPVGHMLSIQVTATAEMEAQLLADALAKKAKGLEGVVLVGPKDAGISKINDVYRKILYLKSKDYGLLVETKDILETFVYEENQQSRASVWFDFDPMNAW